MGFLPRKIVLIATIILLLGGPLFADESVVNGITNSPAAAAVAQLQEQIRLLQTTIASESKNNSDLLTTRIQALEQTITNQHAADLESDRKSQQFSQLLGGAVAILALVILLLMAYFQWRAMTHLVEISTQQNPSFALLPGGPGSTAATISQMAAPGRHAVETSNHRLLGTIEKLERRIAEMEHTSRPQLTTVENGAAKPVATVPPSAATATGANNSHGHSTATTVPPPATKPRATPPERASQERPATDDRQECIANLIAEGQTLLNQNESQKALECFETALGLHPKHCEALVKKGTALERLGHFDEALVCYDLSLETGAPTIAYLQKGGLLNRMARYDDALKCYEFALHTQDKKS